MRKRNIEILRPGMHEYPASLSEINNFPKQLYYMGDISILRKRCAAVVGSRNTNQYGRSTAVAIAGKLAEKDVAVISGMARGIDTCAHRGALDAGGSTVAVLGCGVDICYPEENLALKKELEERGLILSEYPPGTMPMPYHFPQRNRIISGLSEMIVVVQARNSSGALITAELAAEQGREVCAVPGNIDSQYNLGNNKLIKDGARPITNPGDVLEAMRLDVLDDETVRKLLSDTEQLIFSMLAEGGEMTVDELCCRLEKPPAYVNSIVTVMELKGAVYTALGKIFIAKA
ncbi:MAG: DNA-processing protein DprA [Firmicutes bacterium]|nr:DNA-processing protein DprA [Bacillota bacterium]MBR6798628.1 DNA-processing protein DprA [Bacillota bacterium]